MATAQVRSRPPSETSSEISTSLLSTPADMPTTTSSSSFAEILDDTSSDGDDEVIFGLDDSGEDEDADADSVEEDFVLIPIRRSTLVELDLDDCEHDTDTQSDGTDDGERGTTRSLNDDFRRLQIRTTSRTATPEPLSQPVTPITPTTPLGPRRGRGQGAQQHRQQQQQSPTASSPVLKANWATQDRRRRRKAAAARRLAAKHSESKTASNALVGPVGALSAAGEKKLSRGRGSRGGRRRGRNPTPAESYPSPDTSPERNALTERELFLHVGTTEGVSFGGHQLVVESDAESEYATMRYEDAKTFINSFLLKPCAYTRLTFLQSLIIELGLLSPTSELPASMKAATRIIKARAFVNIGDYLHAREKGPQELERIKFKSRRALTNDLRSSRGSRQLERGWVKRHGLDVLLVSVFGR